MKTYNVNYFDSVVPTEMQNIVWDYIQHQTFHATRKDIPYPNPGKMIQYKPIDNKKEYLDDSVPSVNNQYMHRCVFGDTENELMFKHRPIYELWKTINSFLDNKFTILGDREGIASTPPRLARVYVNAQASETIKRSHGIHRDTIDLAEEKNYTLMYIANPVWYPTWMAENVFYADDDSTGDTQQFQRGFGQSRNFPIGYPFAIIPPVAGRIIMYDGRTLHTTKPTSAWAGEMRYAVIFRIKEK